MRGYVGVTDGDWFRFLAARPYIREVNFWKPSGTGFHKLAVGEPFFFKTKAREDNRVVGGGFYSGFSRMPVSEAWTFFGEGNGASSLEELAS